MSENFRALQVFSAVEATGETEMAAQVSARLLKQIHDWSGGHSRKDSNSIAVPQSGHGVDGASFANWIGGGQQSGQKETRHRDGQRERVSSRNAK